jgi:hypothetical protein
MLAHNVFFALKDNSAEATGTLLASCRQFLTDHPGTAFFAAGTLSDLDREVNDRDFDVALHVIFESREAHDAYQKHARHLEFIAANKENWKQVRVFDSDC